MSYTNLVYHIVYGTKDRLPLITRDLRPRLHQYLGGMVNGLHGTPLEINGTADHVHVLARIKPVISIAEFMGKFKWQVKYGAFSVSQSQVERVQRYIRNQEAHHSRIVRAGIQVSTQEPWHRVRREISLGVILSLLRSSQQLSMRDPGLADSPWA